MLESCCAVLFCLGGGGADNCMLESWGYSWQLYVRKLGGTADNCMLESCVREGGGGVCARGGGGWHSWQLTVMVPPTKYTTSWNLPKPMASTASSTVYVLASSSPFLDESSVYFMSSFICTALTRMSSSSTQPSSTHRWLAARQTHSVVHVTWSVTCVPVTWSITCGTRYVVSNQWCTLLCQ